ncbi:MAG: class I SAM-dependent methyltransferase [Bacteroidota bacterium]|nr:class I SAM-dependent methyltransferase [Bacteroidota bacterium]MDP3144485.1 class I SAM-dependent methyltransferase [Bacteroidota bacterium]
MEKHKKCLVCENDRLIPLKGYYDKHGLVKCSSCNFVFMERIPSLQELNDYYSSYSYDSVQSLSSITVKRYEELLDEFEKYRKTNKILDVGCGRGWFLIEAKKRGWEVYGTEFSELAIKLCIEKGINMTEGILDSSKFDTKDFDVITSFEVIEHINNPNQELEAIYNLLRKDGLFYVTTPNFNSLMRYYLKADYNVISYPEHLSYYTKSTLNFVAKRHSFLPIKFQSTGISVTRLNASKNQEEENSVIKEDSDEVLRKKIESKWYLGLAKAILNKLLSFTNSGLTLKGYYKKI